MSSYLKPQPPPTATDSAAVWPQVVDHARRFFDEPHEAQLLELLATDMEGRDAFGRQKYGMPVRVDNGRDHLTDAYQEALDLCVYLKAEDLRQRAAAGRADDRDLRDALAMAFRLRFRLMLRDGR